jgi:hypothetical protein
MYNRQRPDETSLNVNTSYQGERLEDKINRIVNNKEPITDGAPIIFTERKNGVEPQFDIRTDRFEIAIDAMDKVAQAYKAKREENIKNFQNKMNKANQKLDEKNKTKDSGAEPAGGTEKA